MLATWNKIKVALATLLALVVTGCGSATTPSGGEDRRTTPPSTEEAGPQARLAITYDGGVQVLDAASGKVLLDEKVDGYLRLSPAGDDRHALLSRSGGFTALDLGAWTEEHGDHGHSWTLPPGLTDFTVEAGEPGHVVPHHGRTTLFDDATGTATAFDTEDLEELRDPEAEAPETTVWQADEAHHGVAFEDHDGNRVTSVGTEETRSGLRVTTADGETVTESADCPGLHGEAFAGEVALFGCEDGAILLDGTKVEKVEAPDAYGRIGNQAGHETSRYVLGDYKVHEDAELERPRRVAVVDTDEAALRLVRLPASYSFRSLGRTDAGDGLVLGTDGRLHYLDLARGRVSRSVTVLDAWREPVDWQQARPTLEVVGGTAYVTEPAADKVHVVDLAAGRVTRTLDLAVTPDEIVGVTG